MKAYLIAGALALLPLSAPASATVVNYQISGTGTGTLNGSSFTNAAYSILLTGDTASIASCGTFCQAEALSSAVVTINGFGPVTLSPTTRLGIARDGNAFFFGTLGPDLLDFHVTDAQESAFNFLAGYGPVTSIDVFALDQFLNIGTSGGSLTLSQSSNISFSSFIGGGVPEPSSWAMMLLGFGAIGVSLRRRRKTEMAAA